MSFKCAHTTSEPQKMLHTFKKMDAINPTCAIELSSGRIRVRLN